LTLFSTAFNLGAYQKKDLPSLRVSHHEDLAGLNQLTKTHKYYPEIGGAHLAEYTWAKNSQLSKDNRSHSSIHDFKNPTNKKSQPLEVNREVGFL
jgi:hypothetical protein